MRTHLASRLTVALCVISLGCADQSTQPQQAKPASPPMTQMTEMSHMPMRTLRQEFLGLARNNPGFAAVYYNSEGALTINVATDSFDSNSVGNVMRWVQSFSGGTRSTAAPRLNRVAFS